MSNEKSASFEEAMERLDQILQKLDSGEVTLDESLKLFSEGSSLIALCSGKLEEAKLTIDKLFPEELPDEPVV